MPSAMKDKPKSFAKKTTTSKPALPPVFAKKTTPKPAKKIMPARPGRADMPVKEKAKPVPAKRSPMAPARKPMISRLIRF